MTHAQLIARAQSYGLNTREENGGLLLWWNDERIEELMPLVWDGFDGVENWLNAYGEEGAKARGITVKASRSKTQPVAVNQLSLLEM